jgi:(p)ppGpp synthase/HD superfamily hydrolase
MLRQYELVEKVKGYDPDADEDLLNKAYVFSMKAHGTQMRASGDPYFSHPIEVAGLLTDLKLDAETIATAILHDTIEDTLATPEQIEKLFGANVARLVDGVTKLSKIEALTENESAAENLRKFLLAMSDDIRVLLVKLADRLHNMRTLHFIKSEEKRRRIARETMDIYAPLAERIGMYEFMKEMQIRIEAASTALIAQTPSQPPPRPGPCSAGPQGGNRKYRLLEDARPDRPDNRDCGQTSPLPQRSTGPGPQG